MDDLPKEQLISFLASTSLFKDMSPIELREVAALLTVRHLPGGQILMREGEIGKSLYIVESGRLRASHKQNDREETLGEIGRGEIVGEIALIVGTPRTATIRAIRDSVIYELTGEMFFDLSKRFPDIALVMSQFCIKRLIKKNLAVEKNTVSTFAFVPSGDNPHFKEFIQRVATELGKVGPTLHLNQQSFDTFYGEKAAEVAFDSEQNTRIVSWLHQQESRYQYIIYEADDRMTQWTQRCLRQSDQVIFVGLFSQPPHLGDIEEHFFQQKERIHAKVMLVLLHESSTRPTSTIEWLKLRTIDNHYHIQWTIKEDIQKLVRFLTGRALGLVLSGGGARGFSYIGLFRALEELNIKFDMVAGTSVGAAMGALYSMGFSYAEILKLIEQRVKQFHLFKTYTFPILSVMTGDFFSDTFKKYFGNQLIEDLWIKYFCVSSNLSKFRCDIHERGLLWLAVRTSMSAPGLFPPIVNEQNELLVDGGLLNNMPVDIMRSKIGNGKILAVSCSSGLNRQYEPLEVDVSGWKLLFNKMMKKPHKHHIPNIGEVIISSMELSSISQEKKMIEAADYYMNLDVGHSHLFKTRGLKEMVNFSYNYCMNELTSKLFI